MNNLFYWARTWGVPDAAIHELIQLMGVNAGTPTDPVNAGHNESWVGSNLRLSVAKSGGLLWRNNVGAMQDDSGRVVRYGLANESRKMNQQIKSSDYIGIIPTTILPNHVGLVVGQFVAYETKKPGWRWTGTDREKAQMKFLELVTSKGGHATFYTGS